MRLFTVKPEEMASPQHNVATIEQPPEPQYKDKKEAIEAFKELLKDRVSIVIISISY